jgi:general stress protein 26
MTFPGLIKAHNRVDYDERAIDKLRSLVESAKICMFTTSLLQWPLESRPADWQAIDESGNIWFYNGNLTKVQPEFFDGDSVVPHVQVFYSNAGKSEFLSLIGNATVTHNPEAQLMHVNFLAAPHWLTSLQSNTSRQLIKFTPVEAYYWDNTCNTMVPLLRSVA